MQSGTRTIELGQVATTYTKALVLLDVPTVGEVAEHLRSGGRIGDLTRSHNKLPREDHKGLPLPPISPGFTEITPSTGCDSNDIACPS